ncbi:glycosyltransferase family 2 protein [Calothrix sp. UHCC 0171]|uniref:glycosyltransferase family A protein n=1 Tax=Calothrix sp. UHCC 0171 TaxID=3110245 RepID=UPI002B2123F3|nr:glycosyltransferase family 2 protein [Calothrix sp. UHCC 0171]MEA5573959.1 glycosyltransferase family 2 protein [Calothrix sp. UHCC 0171]
MKISIIIPTYNRVQTLRLTIDSFLRQSYDKSLYEIIISNNNSTDSTEELVSNYIKEYPNRIKYIRESRQGVHFARNSAAKIADGEILYFTDDDMIADRNLLTEIVKVFQFEPKIASVTGRILPRWEVNPPEWILQLCYNGLLSLNNPPEDFIISSQDCNVYSCHQAILSHVFFKSGGFNPENTAGEWIGDGETGLNIKIKELGYKFGYNGASIIYHIIPPQRMTQSYLNKRLANQGNCDSYTAYKKHLYSKPHLYKRILINFVRVFSSEIKSFFNLIQGKIVWRMNHAYTFYYLNRIKYDYRLIIDSSWREIVLKHDWLVETETQSNS